MSSDLRDAGFPPSVPSGSVEGTALPPGGPFVASGRRSRPGADRVRAQDGWGAGLRSLHLLSGRAPVGNLPLMGTEARLGAVVDVERTLVRHASGWAVHCAVRGVGISARRPGNGRVVRRLRGAEVARAFAAAPATSSW